MNGHRDPVDSALDALRTQNWSAAPLTPELEKQLMQQAQNQNHHHGFSSRRVMVALVAVVAVGGVAFAATEGVNRLRTWLFDIEVAPGQNAKILVEDGQTGKLIIEDEDGTITEISAQANELADGGTRANVTVSRSHDLGESKEVREVIRRPGPAPVVDIPLTVLEDAELLADWTDEFDRWVEAYAVVQEGKKKAQLYVVVEGFEPDLTRRIIAAPKEQEFYLDAVPKITVDEADTITIEFDAGDRVSVLKFRTASAPDEEFDPDAPIEIEGPESSVTVHVEPGA